MAVSGMNRDMAELLNVAETGGVRNTRILDVGAREERDATGWSRSLGKTPPKLQQKNTGNHIQSAT